MKSANDIEKYLDKINVIYEDNHIIVLSKFANVLSQKDYTNDIDMTEIVKEYLKRKYDKPGNVYLGLVHRLDRRVGGVMLFAKTSKAASRLSVSFEHHEIEKKYLACVLGKTKAKDTLIYKIKKEDNMAYVSPDGKDSSLDYRLINYMEPYSYLYIDLHSGRYNQIRVSMKENKTLIYGDKKYGAKEEDRLGLWCYKISFTHPVTKEKMSFSILPKGKPWDALDLDKLKEIEQI